MQYELCICHIEQNAVEPRYLVRTNHPAAKAAPLRRRGILKAVHGLFVMTAAWFLLSVPVCRSSFKEYLCKIPQRDDVFVTIGRPSSNLPLQEFLRETTKYFFQRHLMAHFDKGGKPGF
jgi:hypothetical protein